MNLNLIDCDARHLLAGHPLWLARVDICENRDYQCPSNFIQFFEIYARAVTPHHLRVPQLRSVLPAISLGTTGSQLAMCSTGSDSWLMRRTLQVDACIRLTDFATYGLSERRHKREFELALVATLMGAKVCYLGISGYDSDERQLASYTDPWQFEYSSEFTHLWNRHFPSTLVYPLRHLSRLEVWRQALVRGVDPRQIVSCERQPDSVGCGRCMKCVERYFICRSLGTEVSPVDPASLRQLALDWSNPDDFHMVKAVIRQTDQVGHLLQFAENPVCSGS
jgi:hypothetical protein